MQSDLSLNRLPSSALVHSPIETIPPIAWITLSAAVPSLICKPNKLTFSHYFGSHNSAERKKLTNNLIWLFTLGLNLKLPDQNKKASACIACRANLVKFKAFRRHHPNCKGRADFSTIKKACCNSFQFLQHLGFKNVIIFKFF